jgi:hypothetical protein
LAVEATEEEEVVEEEGNAAEEEATMRAAAAAAARRFRAMVRRSYGGEGARMWGARRENEKV